MPNTRQSSYSIVSLAEWMMRYDSDLKDVVEVLSRIFELPNIEATYMYVEEEINLQGRLIFFVDLGEILAVAGWRWTIRDDHIAAYIGIPNEFPDPDLRYELIAAVITRLTEERLRSHHTGVKNMIFQYSPIDRLMGQACLDLGCERHDLRNTFFRDHLGARWSLRSMILPFSK